MSKNSMWFIPLFFSHDNSEEQIFYKLEKNISNLSLGKMCIEEYKLTRLGQWDEIDLFQLKMF